jgi:hypothetical protein
MADSPISFDPAMLAQLVQAMQGAQSISGAYRPQYNNPSLAATPGFSLAGTLGHLGEMPAMAGMVGDLMLPRILGSDYTSFVSRINMARGIADPVRERQALQYTSMLRNMGGQDLGNLAAGLASRQFGWAEGSTQYEMVRSLAPVLTASSVVPSLMSPGLSTPT